MSRHVEFRRAVFGFNLETSNPLALDVAARLAELLRLDLVGLFIVDERLQRAAEYPAAREFVSGLEGWRPLNPDQLRQELDVAALWAEHALSSRASARKLTSGFRILAGDLSQTLVSFSTASDILVVPAPSAGTANLTRSSSFLSEAAIRSVAAVLLLPPVPAPLRGAVVAIANSPEDRSIQVASAIAAAANEKLIIIETYAAGAVTRPPETGTGPAGIAHIHGGRELLRDPWPSVSPHRPTRGRPYRPHAPEGSPGQNEFSSALARHRNVPVLVLEPADNDDEGKSETRASEAAARG